MYELLMKTVHLYWFDLLYSSYAVNKTRISCFHFTSHTSAVLYGAKMYFFLLTRIRFGRIALLISTTKCPYMQTYWKKNSSAKCSDQKSSRIWDNYFMILCYLFRAIITFQLIENYSHFSLIQMQSDKTQQ